MASTTPPVAIDDVDVVAVNPQQPAGLGVAEHHGEHRPQLIGSSIAIIDLDAASQQLEPLAQSERQCRICYEYGGEDMIAPCECDGSVKWVHRKCLDTWRTKGQTARAFTDCPNCGFAYVMVLRRPATESEQEVNHRRRRLLRRSLRYFLLVALGLQVYLGLLAMAIRLCDPTATLVKFFRLPQVEDAPDEASFIDSLRYHKQTYYLSAVLVSLFLLGTMTAVMVLAKCSQTYSIQSRPLARSYLCTAYDPFGNYVLGRACGSCFQCCSDGCAVALDSSCEWPCSTCTRDCPGFCDRRDADSDCCVVVLVGVVVLMIVFGIVIFLIALLMWIQKVTQRYYQMIELRLLTTEYIVQDLSNVERVFPAPRAPTQQDLEAPSAPSLVLALVNDPVVQQSLTRDLQAVYGLS